MELNGFLSLHWVRLSFLWALDALKGRAASCCSPHPSGPQLSLGGQEARVPLPSGLEPPCLEPRLINNHSGKGLLPRQHGSGTLVSHYHSTPLKDLPRGGSPGGPLHFGQSIWLGFSRAAPARCHPKRPLRTHTSQLLWVHRGQCCPGPGEPQGYFLGAWGVPPPPGSPPLTLPLQDEQVLLLPPAQVGGAGPGLGKKQMTEVQVPGSCLPSLGPIAWPRMPSKLVSWSPVYQPFPYVATELESKRANSQTTARERASVCARVCGVSPRVWRREERPGTEV